MLGSGSAPPARATGRSGGRPRAVAPTSGGRALAAQLTANLKIHNTNTTHEGRQRRREMQREGEREREKKMKYKEATGACKASKSIIVVVDWKLD